MKRKRGASEQAGPMNALGEHGMPRQLHETVLNMPLVLRVQVLMASSSTSNTSNCLALKNVAGPTCVATRTGV